MKPIIIFFHLGPKEYLIYSLSTPNSKRTLTGKEGSCEYIFKRHVCERKLHKLHENLIVLYVDTCHKQN